MESLSPLTLLLLFLSGLVLFGWIFLLRLQSLHRDKRARRSSLPRTSKSISMPSRINIFSPMGGTYDFALMYIPAQNVYYETIIEDESTAEQSLREYALSKRLIPVSRGSSYASLRAIVLGLKGMKVEARAKEIIRYISRLQDDFARFRNDFDLVGKHLGHAQSSYQSADRPIERFGQKLLSAEIAPGDPATIPALERETG